MTVKEIAIQDITGLHIGYAQNEEAKTGVTVLAFPKGARAGVDISGGGPASRETPVISPLTADVPVNAIVLSGGSAFGLAASDGVMTCLEERGIGYDTKMAKVPIVCQSCIYDLGYGSSKIRPDKEMGYKACTYALDSNQHPEGNYGAGIGATVGKIAGIERASKGGLGIFAVNMDGLQMAAVVVVNSFGDVFKAGTTTKIAGLTTEDRSGFAELTPLSYSTSQPDDFLTSNPQEAAFSGANSQADSILRANTTIAAVVTNGNFTKSQLTKIAAMATTAYARCINPVGTLADGDTVYAASCGTHPADINIAGTLAAQVLATAIERAIITSKIDEQEFLSNITCK